MLRFTKPHRGHVGMAINSGQYDERQRLVDALETVVALSGSLKLYVDGKPFSETCSAILANMQTQATRDGVETFVPEPGKVYGVKVTASGIEPRWYTNDGHTFADADALAKSFNKAKSGQGLYGPSARFNVELIPESERR